MFFKKNKTVSSLFYLQQNGQYGQVGLDDSDSAIEQFVAFEKKSWTNGRGLLTLSSSIRKKRLLFSLFIVVSVFFLFTARSAQLQIIQGKGYLALSNQNKERTELLIPSRGLISDAKGVPLAWNEPAFVLTMTIADLPKTDEREKMFEDISKLIGLQPTDLDLLISQYASHPYDPIPIEKDLPYESAIRLAIEIKKFPGFSLNTRTKRVYSSSAPSLSHIIGYTGTLSIEDLERYKENNYQSIDLVGKTGIEFQDEALLRGIPGKLIYEVDALGNKKSILSKEDPVLGSNLTLSIDASFQKYIEQQLQLTFDRVGASRGSVVAIDPRSGAVRALVSLPTFDANEFVDGITQDRYDALLNNEDHPLFPRAIAGEFPSGSTLKPIIAYAALAESIISEHTSFLSTGGLRIGQWFFPDWKGGGHGITDVRKAISESVNTFFYIVGGGYDATSGLGVSRINEYARKFGFGSQTGIDLPAEADGFLPSKEWKEEVKKERWYVGDTYHLAIGQGDFLTTPLQMASATATIANGGKKIKPYVVESGDGLGIHRIKHETPVAIENLDTKALSLVRQGMRQTVTSGSARSLNNLPVEIAGKTGTAQTYGNQPYHSWFTGFGPYDEASIALVVLIEEGGESNDAAVPLARSILDWWFTNGE
ncbi:penicillin-binding protein 2 [Candidatus Uhrbacteria bacterium]|nr:penicillin-binding protein 2 [Candidatus Uhrbacteria bacterium]